MTPKSKVPVVRLQRTISASPHEVYQAWLDPELLRQWMAPGLDVKRAEVDAREGGHFRIWHTDHGSDVGGFESEIVELVPDERIVFRWGFAGPGRAAVYDSLLRITLRAAKGNATVLTLVHERLGDLAAALPDVAQSVEVGWELVLEKLVLVLGAASRSDPSARRHT